MNKANAEAFVRNVASSEQNRTLVDKIEKMERSSIFFGGQENTLSGFLLPPGLEYSPEKVMHEKITKIIKECVLNW